MRLHEPQAVVMLRRCCGVGRGGGRVGGGVVVG